MCSHRSFLCRLTVTLCKIIGLADSLWVFLAIGHASCPSKLPLPVLFSVELDTILSDKFHVPCTDTFRVPVIRFQFCGVRLRLYTKPASVTSHIYVHVRHSWRVSLHVCLRYPWLYPLVNICCTHPCLLVCGTSQVLKVIVSSAQDVYLWAIIDINPLLVS